MKSAATSAQGTNGQGRSLRATAKMGMPGLGRALRALRPPVGSVAMATLVAVVLFARLAGPPTNAPGAGQLALPGGHTAGISLASTYSDCDTGVSDLSTDTCSSPDGPVTAAELYGGSNPSEACFSCALMKVGAHSGVTKGPVAKRGDPVDTLTGDLSETWNGFSIPAVGNPINLKLTYDAQSAEGQLAGGATYGGEFGFGWHAGGAMSLTYTSGSSATVYQSNGSQVTFDQAASSTSCTTGTNAQYPRTVGGSAYDFCGYPRLDAELGYISAFGSWDFWRQGGLQATYSFNTYGQLAYSGNIHNTNYTSYAYDVAPGSGACPPSSTYAWLNNCTVITDAAGRHVVYGINAYGLVEEVWDPMGREYTFGYISAGTGPSGQSALSLASASDPRGGTTSFSYAGGTSTPYADDLVALRDPMGDTTSFTYNSSGQVVSETAPPASSDSVGVLASTPSYTTSFDYSCTSNCNGYEQTTVTFSNGDQVVDTYSNSLLAFTQLGSGSYLQTWSYQHDPFTLLPTSVKDPTGATTKTVYTTDSTTGLLRSKETTDPTGYVTLVFEPASCIT